MNKRRMMLYSFAFGLLLTLASLLRNEPQSVPDLVILTFGFPLPWLFHQTVSIAGSVDIWSIQSLSLLFDYGFWLIISAILVFTWRKYKTSWRQSPILVTDTASITVLNDQINSWCRQPTIHQASLFRELHEVTSVISNIPLLLKGLLWGRCTWERILSETVVLHP